MTKRSKRYTASAEKVEADKKYGLKEACSIIAESGTAKFDEAVDVVVHLGVDPRKADQNIRGSVDLPNGLGKTVKIAVFAKGDKVEEAKAAGADIVGSDELVEMIQKGEMNFDKVVATPDMMAQVGKVGKLLGPRGLMPSPKVGTVTADVAGIVTKLKAGVAEYKLDKEGAVHTSVARVSFGADKIKENVDALIGAINRAKPQSSKGIYIKSAALATTMGPGVRLDVSELR